MATDERNEAELRERVAELEDRIDNLTTGGEVAVDAEGREWSTADIMNLGLTGVLAVLAGSGVSIWTAIQEATGVASATGTAEVGQLGEPGRPIDGYIEDLYDTNGNPVLEFQGDGSVKSVSTGDTHTETIGAKDYHFAGDYTGADPDARLDAALSDVSGISLVYLEEGTYTANRTIDKEVVIKGVSPAAGTLGTGSRIEGVWTLNQRIMVSQVDFRAEPICNNSSVTIDSSFIGAGVTISSDYCKVLRSDGQSTITFESGTSGGLVDACTRLSVTDNGTNTAGDIG